MFNALRLTSSTHVNKTFRIQKLKSDPLFFPLLWTGVINVLSITTCGYDVKDPNGKRN